MNLSISFIEPLTVLFNSNSQGDTGFLSSIVGGGIPADMATEMSQATGMNLTNKALGSAAFEQLDVQFVAYNPQFPKNVVSWPGQIELDMYQHLDGKGVTDSNGMWQLPSKITANTVQSLSWAVPDVWKCTVNAYFQASNLNGSYSVSCSFDVPFGTKNIQLNLTKLTLQIGSLTISGTADIDGAQQQVSFTS